MEITLDKQVIFQHCAECDLEFPGVRGSVCDGDQPFGLYLIALHGHSPQGRLAHLAVAILIASGGEPRPLAAAMDVIALPEQIGFSLVDWESSPWSEESYLGEMLSRDQVRASPHQPAFLQIAERVIEDIPEVCAYFAEPDARADRSGNSPTNL